MRLPGFNILVLKALSLEAREWIQWTFLFLSSLKETSPRWSALSDSRAVTDSDSFRDNSTSDNMMGPRLSRATFFLSLIQVWRVHKLLHVESYNSVCMIYMSTGKLPRWLPFFFLSHQINAVFQPTAENLGIISSKKICFYPAPHASWLRENSWSRTLSSPQRYRSFPRISPYYWDPNPMYLTPIKKELARLPTRFWPMRKLERWSQNIALMCKGIARQSKLSKFVCSSHISRICNWNYHPGNTSNGYQTSCRWINDTESWEWNAWVDASSDFCDPVCWSIREALLEPHDAPPVLLVTIL